MRGRFTNLKVNYRTSQEIREHADRLLDPEVTDGDGNVEDRSGTLSVFNGAPPEVRICESEAQEAWEVGTWLGRQVRAGVRAEEIVIFVRSEMQIARAEVAAQNAGFVIRTPDLRIGTCVGCFLDLSHALGQRT